MSIGILACTALSRYVQAAQMKMGTDYPVIEIDRNNHDCPDKMKNLIEETLSNIPEHIDTILVAMGACGNCWEGISWRGKLIIPRMDDCITILLHTDDKWHANLKKPGHFYHIDEKSEHFSLVGMYEKILKRHGERKAQKIFRMMFSSYTNVDIVDTAIFDCYNESYMKRIKKDADLIRVPLEYVKGSNLIMEKLVGGNWDEQFIVVEPKTAIGANDFWEQIIR